MNVTKRSASLGVVLALAASLGAIVVAPAALASTLVTSAGTVPVGGTSAGSAAFTFTENSAAAFPPSGGTLVVTITDSASASRVHFTGSPTVTAPGSLGASVAIAAGGSSFTVTAMASDTATQEQVTVSGLQISADAGAALGPIIATLGGTMASSVIGGTVNATGTIQGVVPTSASSVVVSVSSACGFAVTGGSNSTANFSDASDARQVTTVSSVVSGQQTVTVAAGGFSHPIGTTISQTVAYCLGTSLGSPGTVGGAAPTNHLVFITQPGGGTAGTTWAQQPVVAVENALNQIVSTDNTTFVTLSIGTNPAAGALTCTSGVGRTVVNGVATFFGCSITIGSASPYTLLAQSSPVWTPATSSPFLITAAGTTNQLVFIAQPGGGPVGTAWTQQPVVAVENALDQVVSTDNTTFVTLAIGSNPAGGMLTCTSGTGRTVVNGIATFFGCSISVGSASPYTLVATSSPVWTPATSSAFLIAANVTSVSLVDAIAAGVNRGTSGFGTASVVVARNAYITLLGTTSPSLAGLPVQVWSRTRTGAWALVTTRTAAADGTIHYFARVNGWRAYQLRFAGNGTFAPAASHGRIATNPGS